MPWTRHRPLTWALVLAVVTVVLLYCGNSRDTDNNTTAGVMGGVQLTTDERKVDKSKPLIRSGSKLKRILYWNDYYGSKNFGFCCGRGPYLKNNCPNSHCYTSKDRREDLETFDAIVFHGRSLNYNDIPGTRYPHQLYVFLTIESAAYPGIGDWANWEGFFNLTMTYRTDSDVFMPYGRVVRTEVAVNSSRQVTRRKKKKLAAWLVSNCKTQSRREEVVAELERHLPPGSVHIYGKCGSRKCARDSPDDRAECWRQLERSYKFYLALENSVCPDYVTEKMFEALQHDIVPVVLGGADYAATFPAHSFINMRDFRSMADLAQYLVKLDENEDLYSEYLSWKSEYKVLNSKLDFNQAHCRLCEKLHEYRDSETAGKSKVVNLKKWFIDDQKCSFLINNKNLSGQITYQVQDEV